MRACPSCRTPTRPGACPHCGAAVLLGVLFAGSAQAQEAPEPEPQVEAIYGVPSTPEQIGFTPDRPGIGDSTGTVNPGHVMVEGGLALVPEPLAYGTSGIVGRAGVVDHLEARLRAPDLTGGNGLTVGSVGLGTKVAGTAGRFSGSVVPEVSYDLGAGAVGASLGLNASVGFGRIGLWGHSTGAWVQDAGTSLLLGGGVSAYIGAGVGVYGHGGGTLNASGFAGGGAWYAVTGGFQLDAGVDAVLAGGTTTPSIGLGASFGI